MDATRLPDLWPAAGVRVTCGDLELRWIDDDLLVTLAELAGRGVHPADAMPFRQPWTRGTPREVARRVREYQWAARAGLGAQKLTLELGVLWKGIPVGIQGASGEQWGVLREVETGSWLGREHQGRGIGTRMRALVLHFWFDGLGAEHVTSTAFEDNQASNAVSRKVGYETDGQARMVRDGEPAALVRYRMTRDRWLAVRDANAELLGAPVDMIGVAALRDQLDRH